MTFASLWIHSWTLFLSLNYTRHGQGSALGCLLHIHSLSTSYTHTSPQDLEVKAEDGEATSWTLPKYL